MLADIAQYHNSGGLLCSACTGALVLAWAGVLNGRKATTHKKHRDVLADHCEVVDQRLCIDGDIVTSAGISSSIDLGLYLLEHYYGKEVALTVADRIQYKYWLG